jgi:hypothetical protein
MTKAGGGEEEVRARKQLQQGCICGDVRAADPRRCTRKKAAAGSKAAR